MESKEPGRKPVLIVNRNFPPYIPSIGGALRMLKFAEFIRDRSVPCFILAAKGLPLDYYGYEELVRMLNPCYVDDPLQRYITRAQLGRQTHSANGKRFGISRTLRNIVSEWSIPDIGVWFVRRYIRAAQELIRTSRIENVVVSGPPHSDHLVGVALKRSLKDDVNLIIDYRDSWTQTHLFAKRSGICQRLNVRAERAALNAADAVVFATRPIMDKAVAAFSDIHNLREKSAVVLNGYDARQRQNDPSSWSPGLPLSIGYFGAVDDNPRGYRDISPLLRVMVDSDVPIKLSLYGPARIAPEWRDRLGARLEMLGTISHEDAVRAMRTHDTLLLLHTEPRGADEVITGKFFDYVLAGRPILVVGPQEMEAWKLVAQYRLGYCAAFDDPAAIRQTLRRILSDKKEGRKMETPEAADVFSRQYQFESLYSFLR